MIEIKLSQGAKPGHGGVLPAPKVKRRDRGDARRADGRGLRIAVTPFASTRPKACSTSSRACAIFPAASRPASSWRSAIPGNGSRSPRR